MNTTLMNTTRQGLSLPKKVKRTKHIIGPDKKSEGKVGNILVTGESKEISKMLRC
jgi:hypothetical protein